MRNREISFFSINSRVGIIGLVLIVTMVLLICVNTKISWRIVGSIILVGLVFIEIGIFYEKILVQEDKLITKSFFQNTQLYWKEVKKIEMRRELGGKLVTIDLIGVEKKVSVTSLYHNYKFLTKIIVEQCKNNKLTYITEEVLKFIEE